MSTPIVITGVHTGIPINPKETDYPVRLEWNNFVKNPNNGKLFVTLFAKALQLMQAESQDIKVPLSYFQIAGIHGLPQTPWDNVTESKPYMYQYCAHGIPTFPTWHRPYVALYEQTIVQQFDKIFTQYSGPVKERLQNAAAIWRLPYWEWATDEPTIPVEFTTKSIQILDTKDPSGSKMVPLDPNPFAFYKFHPIDPSFSGNYKIYPITLRCPDTSDATASSQPDLVNENLRDPQYDLKGSTWAIFQTTDWNTFSNESTMAADSAGPMSSLEGVHGTVHNCTGGVVINKYGHMTSIPVAGFDPIFWMHHCQVERLLTLWQTINYDSPVPDTKAQLDKPLDPFRKSATAIVTSADIQSTLGYGYIYPEIKAHPNVDQAQLAQLVYEDVERLYGGSNIVAAFKAPSEEETLNKAVEALAIGKDVQQTTLSSPVVSGKTIRFTKPNPGGQYELSPDTYQDWIVNLAVDKYALGGSGRILFFLGTESDIPEDPNEWRKLPSYVGVYDIFAYASPDECQNCKELQEAGYKVGGTVYLTKALIKRGIALVGDEPEKYLKDQLQVRAYSIITGTVYTPETLPSLELSIQSAGYQTTPGVGGPGRPQRGRWQIHRDVTGGRLKEATASGPEA